MNWNERIGNALGAEVVGATRVGGGCIADARAIELSDGRTVFVKTGGSGFLEEAAGLRELAIPRVIRIPEVLYAETDLLVLERIESGQTPTDFMERFGRAFAKLHRHTTERHGFVHDNWIGATPQQNTPGSTNWADFYWTHRLEPQARMAADRGYDLGSDMQKLETKLGSILARTEEAPSLLHGDLWSGNFLCDNRGNPVLIDPAVYYGHREADLGMTHLFGGFSPAFYRAYEEAFPLPNGAAERVPLYKLYHVLNHLNLFGSGYLSQARELLRQLV